MSVTNSGTGRALESFNARFLSASEVASTFVPPPQYDKLLEQNHSVLFGPRGSGKTTLLKMLQLRSLIAWKHPRAPFVRKALPFHAIFLGTDVLWGSQLESRTSTIGDSEKAEQIRRTSFRLHLALAFLNALGECRLPELAANPDLAHFAVDLSPSLEAQMADALATMWRLTPSTQSLLGLRTAVQFQLTDLLALVNKLRLNPTEPLPDYVHVEPMLSVLQAISLVNEIIGQPERRWAILCDELEIAPEMIRHELFELLRSTFQSVVFKFSFFPYSSDVELSALAGPNAPSAGNDYTPLDLTYGLREGAYDFCRALLQSMVSRGGGKPDITPVEVLGDGWFDGGRQHRRATGSPYAPGGEYHDKIRVLMSADPSFRHWIKTKRIDINHIHEMPENDQAQFRKALPYILTRSEFRSNTGRRRSRKSLALYTGAHPLFSLSEANPRVFINLMRDLVDEHVSRGGTVPVISQAKSAEMTIHRFRSSLSAIPCRKVGSIKSILHLIQVVGEFFTAAQIDAPFSPEPPGSFEVDEDIGDELLELVGRTLNAGAFVRLDEGPSSGVSVLKGARLRLCYTLAPEFKLPLNAGRPIKLSTIINALEAGRRRDPTYQQQSRLPFGVDSQ